MTATKRRTKAPTAPPLPAMPIELAGLFRWDMHPNDTGELRLQSAEFTTKWYYKAERAIAEAERYVLSRPKVKSIDEQPTTRAIDAAVRSGDTGGLVAAADALAQAEHAQPPLSADAAAARLRLRGFRVREHGLRWLVRQEGSDRVLTLSPDDLALAARIAQAAGEMLTIDELLAQLERATAPQALTVSAPALTPVVMMDETEARQAIGWMRAELEQVDVSLTSFRRRALEFKEREGWRALGYAGYLEAIQQELRTELSRSYISRLVQAAEVERDLDLPMGKSEEVPERQLRALGTLDKPEARREAWERAQSIAGDSPPTTKHVEQAVAQQKPERRCGRCKEPSDSLTGYGPGLFPGFPDGVVVCGRCISEVLRAQTATPAELPPPPDGWTIYRVDDVTVGLRHVSGYKIGGHVVAALIAEANELAPWLTEIARGEWRVYYDGVTYRAGHEHLDSISASDLPHLALAAWRAGHFEDDLPDWPDALIDALYLAGEDVLALATQGLPLGQLYYLAGLDQPTTTTTTAPAIKDAGPHLPPPAEWKAAQARAAVLGLRLDMAMSGAFCFYRLSDGAAHGGAVDWPATLDLLSRKEVDRLRHLCEQAESLGATIGYFCNGDPSVVQVIPPKGRQQTPLTCNAADLARLIATWSGQTQPSPTTPIAWRAGLKRHWLTIEAALDQGDREAALSAARALVAALESEA